MGGWTKDAAESLGGSEAGLKLILGRIFFNFDEDLDNLMLEFFYEAIVYFIIYTYSMVNLLLAYYKVIMVPLIQISILQHRAIR